MSISSFVKTLIKWFIVISILIAPLYGTYIHPTLMKIQQNVNDPVLKGLVKLYDTFLGFLYQVWFWILKTIGVIGPEGVLTIIEKQIPITHGNVTITKKCICYCS